MPLVYLLTRSALRWITLSAEIGKEGKKQHFFLLDNIGKRLLELDEIYPKNP